jgi:plasmid stability protein
VKTTLDLPDTLMRRVKLRAVHRGQKLKDAVAQLLEQGMAAEGDAAAAPRAPVPVKLKGRRPLSIDDIEDAIRAGRD